MKTECALSLFLDYVLRYYLRFLLLNASLGLCQNCWLLHHWSWLL